MRDSAPHFGWSASRVTVEGDPFNPRAILELELADHSVRWKGSESPTLRNRALVLVRLHSKPLGVLDVALDGRSDGFEGVFVEVSEKLAALIAEHLEKDA